MAANVIHYRGKDYYGMENVIGGVEPPKYVGSWDQEKWIKVQIIWGLAFGLSKEEIIRRLDQGLAPIQTNKPGLR